MDFLYLVTPERKPVRIGRRIGKNIYNRSPESELSGRGHEIHLLESAFSQFFFQTVVRNFVTRLQHYYRTAYARRIRYHLLQGFGESYEYIEVSFSFQYLPYCGCTLHS